MMETLNDQQLATRIESFIAKKDQQYPELHLRPSNEIVESEPISEWLAEKMSVVIESLRPIRLAR